MEAELPEMMGGFVGSSASSIIGSFEKPDLEAVSDSS
jgi:hypothetical protein